VPSNGSVLHDKDLRRLRALRMIEMRVMNMTIEQIASTFNISPITVSRTLTWAKQAGLIADAEDRILQELIPKAIKAAQSALEDDEHKQDAGRLAVKLFELSIPSMGKKTQTKPSSTDQSEDLASYVTNLRDRAVEGDILPSLPSATSPDPSQGPDAPAGGDGDVLGHSAPGPESVGEVGPEGSGEGA
jgi:hypothetical protein